MDIYDASIMDPDPPRPDESSPQRREDDAPPPPAGGEDVSPTLGALSKKHTSNPKIQLKMQSWFLNLKSKLHFSFTNVPHAVH